MTKTKKACYSSVLTFRPETICIDIEGADVDQKITRELVQVQLITGS